MYNTEAWDQRSLFAGSSAQPQQGARRDIDLVVEQTADAHIRGSPTPQRRSGQGGVPGGVPGGAAPVGVVGTYEGSTLDSRKVIGGTARRKLFGIALDVELELDVVVVFVVEVVVVVSTADSGSPGRADAASEKSGSSPGSSRAVVCQHQSAKAAAWVHQLSLSAADRIQGPKS